MFDAQEWIQTSRLQKSAGKAMATNLNTQSVQSPEKGCQETETTMLFVPHRFHPIYREELSKLLHLTRNAALKPTQFKVSAAL